MQKNDNRFNKLKNYNKKNERNTKKESATEWQKPKIEAEVHNSNKKCD